MNLLERKGQRRMRTQEEGKKGQERRYRKKDKDELVEEGVA